MHKNNFSAVLALNLGPGRAQNFGGLVLTGKAADLKSAGSNPLGVRIPRPPFFKNRISRLVYRKSAFQNFGEVAEWSKAPAC